MSLSAAPAVSATAFRLIALLERYEEHVAALQSRWRDTDLYRTVAREIDEIQRHGQLLPELAVAAVALLMAHARLVGALWSRRTDPAAPAPVAAPLQEHQHCLGRLRERCLRQLLRSAR